MKLSLNWIKKFVDVDIKDPEELGKLVTLRTAEVEDVENEAENFANMYLGEVAGIKKHPDADKLVICEINLGEKSKTLVCGGANLKEGMKIAYADKGAKVKWHGEGSLVELGYTKVRGVMSEGMICAGEEIGLETDNPEGQKEVRIHDLSHLNATPGTPLEEALEKNDIIFEIDNKSLTHRPDLWGHYGFAREFAAVLKKDLKPLDLKLDIPKGKSPLKIEVKEGKACPYFAGCVITGLKVEESPQWMKTLLQAAGVRPVNNLVDVTNYVMIELGQPMHAYDRQVVGEDFLGAKFAKEGEELETLDHKKRKLSSNDLIIYNSKEAIGLAGIMGGVNTEINDNTTEIILEAANFNPVTVRKTSTMHGLRTDAVQRFEKSLDPLMAKAALIRACQLYLELCPDAKLEGGLVEVDNYKVPDFKVRLDPEYVNKVIGADIKESEMVDSLTRLGFEIKKGKTLEVSVPSWRATKDVEIQEDLIEEIARMYGYENIEPHLPPLPIVPPRSFPEREHKHVARKILGLGLNCFEVLKYSFYSQKDVKDCFLDEADHLRVQNYLSEDQTHMRTTLIPNMLKAAHLNLKYREVVRIFEFGRTYKEAGYMPIEHKYLCGILADSGKKKKDESLVEAFYGTKGLFEEFMKRFGAESYRFKKADNPPAYAHPKKCLEIEYRGKSIGHLFTLHPIVLKNYDIDADTAAFEIDFTQLIASGLSHVTYSPLPKLPGLTFDISVVTDRQTEIGNIEKVIKKQGGSLVKHVELFDIYEGTNIDSDKKSLAFRITLQSDERTLTDNDMAEIQKKIFGQLIKQGGEIRGL